MAIVTDEEIARFNLEYLRRDRPTNVIAFPMREGDFAAVTPDLLGDVMISTDTAAREAKEAGLSLETRFFQLLVHGILHLFGYDHEQGQEAAEEMERKSNEVLSAIGVTPMIL